MSFMTEAAATLEYETYDYSLPHSKTVDLIGEEFIKKEAGGGGDSVQTQGGLLQLAYSAAGVGQLRTSYSGGGKTTSLPPLTYTTTTIPTISSLGCQVSSSETENGVLYCNLDDLSRYIPDNFSFDTMVEHMEADSVADSLAPSLPEGVSRVQVLSLPSQPVSSGGLYQSFVPRTVSSQHLSNINPSIQIQLKSNGHNIPTSMQTFTIPTIDTTKLTGQLSVVQELPEVSKLVFQEVKQESPDSIVNILEHMKQEDPSSLSPLDYTVSSTTEAVCGQPLNLVNNLAKGVKRVVAPVQNLQTQPDPKRIKNVIVVQGQNGQQIIQEVHHQPSSHFEQYRCSPSPSQDLLHTVSSQGISSSVLCIEPLSPSNNSIKKEPKSKSNSPKLSLNKPVGNSALPSSKTCNWVFENGQVCGKTFSKSYNLVVHMRMHEDIRPFACTLCDQTFRQKAHLQRHETTHGIQTKNFYRTPSSKKKKKSPTETSPVKMSETLQARLSMVSANLSKSNGEEDSEGDEYNQFEDDEDDQYLHNGNDNSARSMVIGRKYSPTDMEQQAASLDSEVDSPSGPLGSVRGKLKSLTVEAVHHVDLNSEVSRLEGSKSFRGHLQVETDGDGGLMNLVVSRQDDDDTSTVQDMLQTVNSVPTLEQKLEASPFLNCDNLLLRALPQSKPIMSVSAAPSYMPVSSSSVNTSLPHITKLVESTSVSHQPCLTTTTPQNLPGTSIPLSSLFHSPATNNNPSSNTNILFTTLSNPASMSVSSSSQKSSLSFIETSVPASSSANSFTNSISTGNRQLIIDNIDDHSPEIQAEILNALLADETYGDADQQIEEVWEEEIFRLSSLPATWWVSRRRRAGTTVGDVTYYSPQGYCFKNRLEIQDFLQNNMLPKDIRNCDLRSPPLPIEQIPIIEENFVPKGNPAPTMPSTMSVDTNSIAQALIANLRPEPIESLKEALNLNNSSESKQLGSPEASLSLNSQSPPPSMSLLTPMPTVS